MDLALKDFNRIIDVTFYTAGGGVTAIKCPRHGRKPSIEITGSYSTRGILSAFNITIKNLYLDLQTQQYARIKVKAGYANNLITIEGTILTMYQEAPGPDGKTVIQCQLGGLQDWLDGTVDLNFDAGTSITDVLDAIKDKLKATQTKPGDAARTLTLKEPFMYTGSARDAMKALEKKFIEDNLVVFLRNNTVYAECVAKGDHIGIKVLKFMSAPPQPNTGGEAGTYYTTVTAPWIPDLQLFDILEIPSRVYIRNYGLVGTGKTQRIQVTTLSFHFGTTGSTNSMTVQGFLAE